MCTKCKILWFAELIPYMILIIFLIWISSLKRKNSIESINHELLHFLHNKICFDTPYHPIDTGEKAKETLLKNDPWATLKSSIALRNVLLINLNWSDSWYPINLSKINLIQNRSDSWTLDIGWSNIICMWLCNVW